MASARVIQVISGKRWTPVFQHPLEVSGGQVFNDHILVQIGQTNARQGRIEELPLAIEGKWSIDMHVDQASRLFEFPGVEAAGAD